MKGIETSLRICQSCSSKSIHNHIRRQSTSTLLNSRRITSNPISSTCNSSRSQSSSARPIDSDLFTSSTSSAYASQSSSSNSSNNQFSSSTSFPSPSSLTRTYGQPLPHTHPHLFPLRDAVGSPVLDPSGNVIPTPELELTPGISALEYEERRKRLMKRLPEGSIVVATAGRVKCMSANILWVSFSLVWVEVDLKQGQEEGVLRKKVRERFNLDCMPPVPSWMTFRKSCKALWIWHSCYWTIRLFLSTRSYRFRQESNFWVSSFCCAWFSFNSLVFWHSTFLFPCDVQLKHSIWQVFKNQMPFYY